MGMNLKLGGSLRGRPLLWNKPTLALNGAATLDLARTRQRLAAASPGLRSSLEGWPALAGALLACLAVALLDETVQHFTPGRAFELRDVALDLAAALTGILLFLLINRLIAHSPQSLST
jgi:hypothetical protein